MRRLFRNRYRETARLLSLRLNFSEPLRIVKMAPNNKVRFHDSHNVRLNWQWHAAPREAESSPRGGGEGRKCKAEAMNFLLGKKSSKSDATPSQAILKLRDMEALLTKKQEFLETKIQKELATALKNASSNKRAALIALKRKHRLEEQLKQVITDCYQKIVSCSTLDYFFFLKKRKIF